MRIVKYDNAKAVLIYLVVLGHLSIMYASNDAFCRWLTLFIYTFHMPAFIFLAGLFHKKPNLNKAVGYLCCAYLLKIILHLTHFIASQSPTFHLFTEPEVPWFLVVLAEYELLGFVTAKTKKKVLFVCSVLLSIMAGFIPFIDFMSIGRMLLFSPFYVLGEMLDRERLMKVLENGKLKIISCGILITLALVCVSADIYKFRDCMTGRQHYWTLESITGIGCIYQPILRIAVLGVMLIAMFAVLSLMPSGNIKYVTKSGQNTLQVYFWHRPICFMITSVPVIPTIIYPIAALALTAILNTNAFREPTTAILEKVCRS